MKRLIIRIGSLVVVVVLGMIAIAHAQRNAETQTPAEQADTLFTPPSTQSIPKETKKDGLVVNPLRGQPLRSPGSAEAPPRRIPDSASARPLQASAQNGDRYAANAKIADPFLTPASADVPASDVAAEATASTDAPNALTDGTATASAPLKAPETNAATIADDRSQPASPVNYRDMAGARDRYAAAQTPASNNQDQNDPRPRYASRSATNVPPSASQSAPPMQGGMTPQRDRNEPQRLSRDGAAPFASSRVGERAPINPGDASVDGTTAQEGAGQPGAKQLEGQQSAQVVVQKFAPKEVQVGKPAVIKVTVRNVGQTPASQVEIHDQTPRGARLLNTTPRASQNIRGELVWTLGTLRPNEEAAVEMEIMPQTEGEIGSVATVHFGADASARSIVTKPQLVIEANAASKVLIGETVTLSITVSNPGSGAATGVVLEEHLPQGFQHPAGSELEYDIGTLRPGESKKIELRLTAATAGAATNLLAVRGDGNLRVEDRRPIEVIAPKLELAMDGPKRRYLEREATYQVTVSNPGSAPAQDVELVAYLPAGLKFVGANNAGQYVEAERAVHWRLEELPAQETGKVELVTMPTEPGQQRIKIRGMAQRGVSAEREQPVIVEGIAAVMFQVADTTDPIEVGGETTYEVRVVNQGSKAASNLRLAVTLPQEMQPLAAEGPTRYAVESNAVIFDGLARLAPKAETTYRIRVKALRPGDLRAKFQLLTDEMQSPVTKEESTRVFADE